MTQHQMLIVIVLVLSSHMIVSMIRDVIRHIRGPSKRDFANACGVITEWIVRHNVKYPSAQIKYIQLSEEGPEGAALKVPKK